MNRGEIFEKGKNLDGGLKVRKNNLTGGKVHWLFGKFFWKLGAKRQNNMLRIFLARVEVGKMFDQLVKSPRKYWTTRRTYFSQSHFIHMLPVWIPPPVERRKENEANIDPVSMKYPMNSP